MTASWDAAFAASKVSDTRFDVHYPEKWFQGPGAFGGLVFASLGHAMAQAVNDPTRPLRNLQVQMCAPPGPAGQTIEVEVVRSGGRVSYTRGLMRSGDKVCAIVSGVFGGPMASDLDEAKMPMPTMPPIDDITPMPISRATPIFLEQFEVHVGQGGKPASSHHEAMAAAWIKLRETPHAWDPWLTLGLVDVLWPAILAKSDTFRRVGTISFSVNLMDHPAHLNPADRAVVLSESRLTQQGYSDEKNIIWGPHGEVLAIAHQLVAIIQ